jgi:PEP-CTERM motif
MGAKRAVLRAAAAMAVFSTVCRSAIALATPNDSPIDVSIYELPVTTIYNLVNNSVTLQEIHTGFGNKPINIINDSPTTTIYNLIENAINIQIDGPAAISGSIDGSPITTIYNDVDNSINFSDLTGARYLDTITRIDSSPTTIVRNLVDNSINITTDPQGDSSSSQSAVLLTPTSQSIVIDNEAVTNILNYVNNSITVAERISTLSGRVVTNIKNDSTTNIFNIVDNAINLELSDPLGIPVALFIDSMPTTLIDNWVDNSVNVTVAVPEPSSWSLLALGFCAFGLLRKATIRRGGADAGGTRQHEGAEAFTSGPSSTARSRPPSKPL